MTDLHALALATWDRQYRRETPPTREEALAAAAGACAGTCQVAERLRQELEQARQAAAAGAAQGEVRAAQAARIRVLDAEIKALREQIEQERLFRKGLVP